jgi:hypothetical protein
MDWKAFLFHMVNVMTESWLILYTAALLDGQSMVTL